jgi:phosphatidate cytidylyltransferase
LGRAEPSSLLLRVLSALVLAPVALAAVWFGPPFVEALVVVAVAAMSWEWARLSTRGGVTGGLVLATGVGSVLVLALGAAAGAALVAALAGAIAVAIAAALTRRAEPLWAAAGVFWLALGSIAFAWEATPPGGDRYSILWLLAVVWASDSGAYAAGRSLGGPKLAPRFSPNKTWAGFGGGLASAALMGFIAACLAGGNAAIVVAVSLGLAIAAQLGDLAESAAKRHFGVKDTSRLIPGHGGLLDRVDGLLAAAAAAAAMTLVAGSGPLAWR